MNWTQAHKQEYTHIHSHTNYCLFNSFSSPNLEVSLTVEICMFEYWLCLSLSLSLSLSLFFLSLSFSLSLLLVLNPVGARVWTKCIEKNPSCAISSNTFVADSTKRHFSCKSSIVLNLTEAIPFELTSGRKHRQISPAGVSRMHRHPFNNTDEEKST